MEKMEKHSTNPVPNIEWRISTNGTCVGNYWLVCFSPKTRVPQKYFL